MVSEYTEQLLGTTIRYVVDRPPIAKDVFVKEMTRLVQGHPIAKSYALQWRRHRPGNPQPQTVLIAY
jgi:hypothetical protein